MAQQSGVAVSCSTGDREFVGKEVAVHVEDAVVELKGTRIVEEKELLIGLEDAAAPIEELGAVAAVAPEAPIHDEEVAEVAFESPIHEEVPEVAPEMKVIAKAIAMVEEGTLAVEEDALMEQKGVFTALEEEGAAPMQESPIETQAAPAVEEIEIDEVPAFVQEIVVEEDAFVVKASPTALNSKHKVFLSHSGKQKAFVERLCVALEKCYLYPFFDLRDYSLPIGKNFADLIFDAIKQCHVGVVVLSDEFFTSKWPMMELVAMVDEMKKRYFTIIPVFYSISIKEFDDPAHRKRWLSEWHELAKKNPNRVEVEKWEATLRYLRPINGLVYDGLSELSLENKIVDKICALVPPEIRLDDNHIQGREHLCKEIQDKIGALQKVQKNGICTIGLYGMGGIGKTSICKVLCNEFFIEFRGRICHAELGRKSERELMCEVVKKLTDTSHERLNGFDVDQLREALKKGIIKEAVFLAVDNISDSDASIKEAMNYLSASLPSGSIVMVTARSKDFLKNLRPYIDESKCLEMPDLKVEHAVLLFAKASHFEPRNEDDKQLLKRCVQKGCFQKGDGNASCHFHPLALDVLGRHLGRRDPNEWGAQLHEIDRIGEDRRRRNPVSFIGKDIINPRIEAYDSIFYESVFPIFRTSFVTLSDDEQLLVMDIALNLFPEDTNAELHSLWIGIVHGIPSIEKVKISLEKLKSLSLLESLGDGRKISIGMHDLWRAFCVAETEHGKLKRQRWVYEHMDKCSKLVENSPSVTWESVKRMAFLDCELKSLERVKFAHFPNVTVLKIRGINMTKELVVNLSELIHLKSLEVSGRYSQRLIVQGLPRSLMYISLVSDTPGLLRGRCLDPFFGTSAAYFSRQIECTTTLLDEKISEVDKFSVNELNLILELSRELTTYVGGLEHWKSRSNSCGGDHCKSRSNSRELIDQIVDFEDLQFLLLVGYGRGKVLDMRSMVSMRAAGFDNCENLVTLTGLSSKMTNLRGLSFEGCKKLRSCPGVGDLVVLEVLNCKGCRRLRRLPNLQKLINLRKLNISGCPLIVEVPGLRHLVALKKFSAGASGHEYYLFRSYRLKLPDMNRLSNLQTLRLRKCRLKADTVLGLSDLISLQRLEADFREIADRPSLGQLTKLQELLIKGWSSEELGELNNLVMLQTLKIARCSGVDKLPGIQGMISLHTLDIGKCEFMDLSTLSNLSVLESLTIRECSELERLPDLQRLTRLNSLYIANCYELRGWDGTLGPTEITNLRSLHLSNCDRFNDLMYIGAFSQLEELVCWWLTSIRELPDLSNFPQLETLELYQLTSLRRLTCREPMNALLKLETKGCSALVTIPDLSYFPGLLKLDLRGCLGITTISSTGPLTALQVLELGYCSGLKTLPNLGMFLALEKLSLKKCEKLMTLSSSRPLPLLKELDARKCWRLNQDDLGRLQALCPQCKIKYPTLESTWKFRLLGCSN